MTSLKNALQSVGIFSIDTSEYYQVLFMQHFIVANVSHSHGYANCNKYLLGLEKNNKKFVITIEGHYGDCYSRHTAATSAGYSIEEVYNFKGMPYHFLPKEDIYIHIETEKNKYEQKTKILNHFGEILFTICNNGDEYYPHGWVNFEGETFFTPTIRYTGKRKVFLVSGKSNVGKSTLFPDGLELESLTNLSEDIIKTSSVIISSPYSEKYVISKKDIVKILEEDPLIEIVYVDLST